MYNAKIRRYIQDDWNNMLLNSIFIFNRYVMIPAFILWMIFK